MTETSFSQPETAIVFLDLDDVVCLNAPYGGYAVILAMNGRHRNPQDVYEKVFHARTRRVLKAFHEQMAGRVRYVISSTWREWLNREQMVNVFKVSNLGFVADALFEDERWCTATTSGGSTRAEEIADWLDDYHAGEPFVILDDTRSGASLMPALEDPLHRFAGRVLLCDEWAGLLDWHVPFIVAALQRPLTSKGSTL